MHHDHEEKPPDPATIHSVVNAPAFGDPISPSIATTTTVAAPAPPAESNTTHPRHLSGNSTTATTGSSIRYGSPHQPCTHSKPSPMRKPYRSLWAVLVRGHQRNREVNGQVQSQRRRRIPSRSLEAGARTCPSCIRCSKTKIYTRTCGSSAPHVIGGKHGSYD